MNQDNAFCAEGLKHFADLGGSDPHLVNKVSILNRQSTLNFDPSEAFL